MDFTLMVMVIIIIQKDFLNCKLKTKVSYKQYFLNQNLLMAVILLDIMKSEVNIRKLFNFIISVEKYFLDKKICDNLLHIC